MQDKAGRLSIAVVTVEEGYPDSRTEMRRKYKLKQLPTGQCVASDEDVVMDSSSNSEMAKLRCRTRTQKLAAQKLRWLRWSQAPEQMDWRRNWARGGIALVMTVWWGTRLPAPWRWTTSLRREGVDVGRRHHRDGACACHPIWDEMYVE